MRYAIRALSLILCCTFISCASSSKHALIDTSSVVAFEESDTETVVSKIELDTIVSDRQIDIKNVPFLTMSKSLMNYRPHRAYAVGYPYKCGGSWHSWSNISPSKAAENALNQCIRYVKGREKHMGKKCGARLILVDKKLLVNPAELPTKIYTPFVMNLLSNTNQTSQIYGMFAYVGPGKDLPLEMYNEKGAKICTGNYSLTYMQAVVGGGTFNMNCFSGKVEAFGSFSIKNIRKKNSRSQIPVGVGKGTTMDGDDFKFITGMSVGDYDSYKHLLEK